VEARRKAQAAEIVQTLRNLGIAMELFYSDNGRYPEAGTVQIGSTVSDATLFEEYISRSGWESALDTPDSSLIQAVNSPTLSCGARVGTGGYIIGYMHPDPDLLFKSNYIVSNGRTYSGDSGIDQGYDIPLMSQNAPCVGAIELD